MQFNVASIKRALQVDEQNDGERNNSSIFKIYESPASLRNISFSFGLSCTNVLTPLISFKGFLPNLAPQSELVLSLQKEVENRIFISCETAQELWNKAGILIDWQNTHDNVKSLCKQDLLYQSEKQKRGYHFHHHCCVIVVIMAGKKSHNIQRKGKIHL